jgi:aminoglycoside 6'-N-acetyltransferase
MRRYSFRELTRRDLPMVRSWLEQPHWREWWGEAPDEDLAEIEAHIDSISVEPFIIEMDGKPIGYLQTYDPHLEDGHPYADQPFGTLGIDLSIGEAALIHKGHGSRALDAFADLMFSEGVPRLIIDPDPANAAAIRAYEKAGFVAFDTRTSEYGPAVMMARDNPDEAGPED